MRNLTIEKIFYSSLIIVLTLIFGYFLVQSDDSKVNSDKFLDTSNSDNNIDFEKSESEEIINNYDEGEYNYYDASEEKLEYNGYPCTIDCSGHEAGYEWAEEKGITDPNDCGGNSNSFIEGCESYANDNQDYYEEEDDYDPYSY